MKTYRVVPITDDSNWKIQVWKVKKDNWFGGSTLSKFNGRQEAIDYVKQLGDKNRPSKVMVLNYKGSIVCDWKYGERPRVRS